MQWHIIICIIGINIIICCVCILLTAAPSIANVKAAIEHIYPLVLDFRMEKPEHRMSDVFRGGSAPTFAQSKHHHNSDDDGFD